MYYGHLYGTPALPPEGPADCIWVNARIYSMEERSSAEEETPAADNSLASAICVRNGKIQYVGTGEGARTYQGGQTRIIDADGATILPAFMDCHTHAPGLFEKKKYLIYLNGSEMPEEMCASVSRFVKSHPENESYFGFGYSAVHCPDPRGPRKEWLDEICPEKPIVIQAADGHSWWCNTPGMALFGLGSSRPLSGMVVTDDAGAPWGILQDFTGEAIPRPHFTLQQDMDSFLEYQNDLHRLGYSGIRAMEGQITPCPLEAMHQLDRQGRLKLRIRAARTIFPDRDVADQIEKAVQDRRRTASDLLDLRIAKFFHDGTIGSESAWLRAPYRGHNPADPEAYGHCLWESDAMLEAFHLATEQGLQIHVHSIGDRSTEQVLDVLELLRNEVPNEDLRPGIAHLDMVNDTDLPRFSQLGCLGSIQSYWSFKEPGVYDTDLLAHLGTERAERTYPFRRLMDAGALLSNGSDQPSTEIPDPFMAIQIAVTRNLTGAARYGIEPLEDPEDPQWLLDPAERLTREEAVKTFTVNAAYDMFLEDETGTLTPGKSADFLLLDRDIFRVPVLEIEQTQVLCNVFRGEVVWSRDAG